MDEDGVYIEIKNSTARYVVAQEKQQQQQQYVNVKPFPLEDVIYANT